MRLQYVCVNRQNRDGGNSSWFRKDVCVAFAFRVRSRLRNFSIALRSDILTQAHSSGWSCPKNVVITCAFYWVFFPPPCAKTEPDLRVEVHVLGGSTTHHVHVFLEEWCSPTICAASCRVSFSWGCKHCDQFFCGRILLGYRQNSLVRFLAVMWMKRGVKSFLPI